MSEQEVFELCQKMRFAGYSVVCFTPEQLACFKPGVVQRDVKAIRAAISKATGEDL